MFHVLTNLTNSCFFSLFEMEVSEKIEEMEGSEKIEMEVQARTSEYMDTSLIEFFISILPYGS